MDNILNLPTSNANIAYDDEKVKIFTQLYSSFVNDLLKEGIIPKQLMILQFDNGDTSEIQQHIFISENMSRADVSLAILNVQHDLMTN